jgi:hypothetical protein
MKKPPATCEASEVYDFWHLCSSSLPIRSFLKRTLIGDQHLSMMTWCDHRVLHFLSGTPEPIAPGHVDHCSLNTIHTLT